MSRPFAAVLALVGALALAAAGCGGGRTGPAPGGMLTLARRDSFATFDPAFAWTPEQAPYLDLVFEGLVALDDSGRVRPACAARWASTLDRRTFRFTLRRGLVYADGSPLRARDFVHGLDRLFRAGPLRSPGAPQFASLAHALVQGAKKAPPLGVEAPDDTTVVIRLAWPDASLLLKLAQPRYAIPVPEGRDARLGREYGAAPATDGPYALVRGGRDTLLFVRNPHYALSKERGGADTIRVLSNRQPRQALLGLESGRVDGLVPPPLEYLDRVQRSPDVTLVEGHADPPVTWYLALNAELAPLARRDARRAVAWGVNREHMVEQLGDRFAPERLFAAPEPSGRGGGAMRAAAAPGYDPAQSSFFLAAADAMSGIRMPVTVPRASLLAAGLEALTPGLARAGIQVDAVVTTGAAWETAALSRRGTQATLVPFRAVGDDPLEALAALLLNRGLGSGWAGNVAWYHPDSGLDSLLVAGLREPDPAARAAITGQVETLLQSDLPLVPLARVADGAAMRSPWTGIRFKPGLGLDLRAVRRGQSTPPSDTSP